MKKLSPSKCKHDKGYTEPKLFRNKRGERYTKDGKFLFRSECIICDNAYHWEYRKIDEGEKHRLMPDYF